MNINWNEQAKEFMRLHGWKQYPENPFNPEAWGHPAFPIMEDVEAHGGAAKFCELYYASAWKIYKSYVEGMVVLSKTETNKGDNNDQVL